MLNNRIVSLGQKPPGRVVAGEKSWPGFISVAQFYVHNEP